MIAAVIGVGHLVSHLVVCGESELTLGKDGINLLFVEHAVLVYNFFLVLNFDLLVWTLLINFNDVGLSECHQFIANILLISPFGILLDLITDLWIFWEQKVSQVGLANRYGFNIFYANVDEFGFLVMANIVVANVVVVSDFNAEAVLLLRKTLTKQIVSNAHTSLLDKVHVRNFILFI